MTGSLRYRDGAWRLTYQADGRRHYRTVHAPDNRTGRREAERQLAALVTEADQQRLDPARITVGQALTRWLDHHARDIEARTHQGYELHVRRHLAPTLGDVRLDRLRTADIDAAYRRLGAQGLSAKTVRNAHGTLHAALAQAVRWGWIARNPADAADPPKAKAPPIAVPEPATVAAIIAAARPDFAVYLRLASTTGHRRGSLLALRWTDTDLDGGTVTFARALAAVKGRLIEKGTKADRIDRATLGAATLDALRSHRTRCAEAALACGVPLRPDGFCFTRDPDGERPWHPSGVNVRWRVTLERAKVTGVRPHDLKHFAATHMLSAGVPPHVVAQRTGTSAQTLQRIYAHALPGADAEAAEMMDRLLG